ncbi:nonstructural protein [Apis mellifera associated microvirus 27]|nr:nonstructural protein [Apis mellifera associated microvirus 27]
MFKMYSICDTKAEIFHPPFFKKTHGEAERDFQSIVNEPKSTLHNHPEDFDLYYLGTYDDTTGKINPVPTPEHIVKAAFLKQQNP